MFIAVARIPAGAAVLQQAAAITGLAVADVSRLLAGTLPRILVRAITEGERIAGALEAVGFVAFAADESALSTDQQRIVARNLELSATGLVAVDGSGQHHDCPADAIGTFIRGIRLVEMTEIIKTATRKLDIGKALITSGLSVTKKVETTSERVTASKEPFLLLQRRDGGPDVMLYEQRLNYQCLGRALQPSTFGNFTALTARLRSLAPHAPLDDRITRPGFLVGLPRLSADPVDLALYLVSVSRLRGC